MHNIFCPSSDEPTGTIEERIVWAAIRRLTFFFGICHWTTIQKETGCSYQEIYPALIKLEARGIVKIVPDACEGIYMITLNPEHAIKFPQAYARLLPSAEILGGRQEPTPEEDQHSICYLLETFPPEAIQEYARRHA
jgi:hypothetical protein